MEKIGVEDICSNPREWYENDINNISYWFPKIENCGIDVPRTKIIQVPNDVLQAFFMDHHDKDKEKILSFVEEQIMPVLTDMNLFFFFMKIGTFSNKFDFRGSCKCRAEKYEIMEQLSNIAYTSETFGAQGLSEIAIREFISDWYYIEKNIPCIYNGMPLRPEFRVFYDFDEHKVLYSVNYWDWDYCHKRISDNITDKIIYEYYYDTINQFFIDNKDKVEKMVATCMKGVNLKERWSIDIMWDEQSKTYYLIDMATAQTSAYWKGDNDAG